VEATAYRSARALPAEGVQAALKRDETTRKEIVS